MKMGEKTQPQRGLAAYGSECEDDMPRRSANLTQADIARAIRAAKQAGAESVEVRPNGTIIVLLKNPPVAPQEPLPVDHEIIL